MSAAPVILTGAAAVKAARNIASLQDNREMWPYPWVYPPPDAEDVFVEQSIPAPAFGVETQILQYKVPSSYLFMFTHIVQVYTGTAFVPGSGDILWTLDLNTPIGTPPVQASRLQGFQSVDVPLGSFQIPWPIRKARFFKSLDIIRSKVITTNVIVPGSGNFFTTILLGYIMPASK